MENIIYDGNFFLDFFETCKESKKIAISKNRNVQFDFNQILCVVSKDTNLDYLYRDYQNAHLMDWKTVGPDCVAEYNSEVKQEFEKRKKIQEEQRLIQENEWREKYEKEREAFELKVKGIEFDFSDKSKYDDWKKKNTDDYGAAIFEYAEAWAKLMQAEMATGKTLIECAEKTSFELGFLGITGFMYGAAVSILSECWKHGEQLRKWHNKEWGHDGDGVVNPAILQVQKNN